LRQLLDLQSHKPVMVFENNPFVKKSYQMLFHDDSFIEQIKFFRLPWFFVNNIGAGDLFQCVGVV
jgi:hypothetical protein